MKNILFIFLFIPFVLNAQISIIDNYAINCNYTFLQFNKVITACSFGGNIKTAKILINNLDKNSLEYHIATGMLLYNFKGKKASMNYIEKVKLNNTQDSYVRACISLLTENIDDYHYYLGVLNDNVLKTKLKIRSLIKRYSYKYLIKQKIISETEKILATKNLKSIDRLFFSLAVVDFKNWNNDREKYAYLLKIYKEFTSRIDDNLCLKYLKFCKGDSCNKIKEALSTKENAYKLIDKEFLNFRHSNEKKLTEIIENNSQDELHIKSYIFLHQAKLPRDLQIILGIRTNYEFNESFINYLKKGFNKNIIIANILKEKSILVKEGIPVNRDLFNKLKDDELFTFLGIKNHLKKLNNEYKEERESYNLEKRAHFYDYKSWSSYLTYLKRNPFHSETKVLEIENSRQYFEVLKKLNSFHPYNFNQKKLYLSTLVDNKRFFKLNAITSKVIINNMIDILMLNQDECNPEHSSTRNNHLYYYLNINHDLVEEMFNKYSSYSNSACLKYLSSAMSIDELKKIIDSLSLKMKIHSNNQNLQNVFTILTKIYDDNQVFNTYESLRIKKE